MRKLLSLISALLVSGTAQAGVLCDTYDPDGCVPVVEHLYLQEEPGRAEIAVPVEVGYIRKDLLNITLSRSVYGSIGSLENDMDGQAINIAAQLANDDKFMELIRKSGEVFNTVVIRKKVIANGVPILYTYRIIVLPTSSVIVMRKAEVNGTTNPITFDFAKNYQVKDLSPVVLYTGASFWKSYTEYVKSGGKLNPLEYWYKKWKRLERLKSIALPPVLLFKNGNVIVMRGRAAYYMKEATDEYLAKLKTIQSYTYGDYTIPAGTTLLTVRQELEKELSANGEYTGKAKFLAEVLSREFLSYTPNTIYLFDFDLGRAFVKEEDGIAKYRLVYAATPAVLRWKVEGDVHYTQFGMDDPSKVYWNSPLRAPYVLPERVACLYWSGDKCERFTRQYVTPAYRHPALYDSTSKYFHIWKSQLSRMIGGVLVDPETSKILVEALMQAIWAEKVDPELISKIKWKEGQELFKQTVVAPVTAASRAEAEENYVLVCNGDDAEALLVVPEEYKTYAEETGQVLKDFGNVFIYFDNETRIPLPVDCEGAREIGEEINETVYKLTAPPIPSDVLAQALFEQDVQAETFKVYTPPAVNGGDVEEPND